MLSFSILPLLFIFGLVCSAQPLEARQSTAPFKIYAYGKNISGLPVFYNNGAAEVADTAKVDATAMTPVNFTYSNDSSNTWMAYPSSTGGSARSSRYMLYLGQGNASANPVSFSGISDSERANKLGDVWSLYGNYVLVKLSGVNFYATSTGTDGLYSLTWSSSAKAMTDSIPLVLRTTEPATNSVLT